MAQLKGKVAIIAGGSGGIGSAICERLASEGASVVVHFNDQKNTAQQIVQKIVAAQGQAIAIQANLSQSAQVSALFDQTEQQFGTPDIVVNVAGMRFVRPIVEMTDEDFDKVFEVNTKGAFFCMREAAKRLNDHGRIVNISSGLVVRPNPGYGLYVSSKAAVEQLGKVLSIELGNRGITVNTVSPGPTATAQLANSGSDEKAAAAQSPFNRIGQPSDIADVIAFVVSEQCRWITGHTFQASGGYV
jgi:3-oxoacyl-[acyl-carrier protein] reductase